jgi:ribosomal protein S18 acetylase RimI-like enzyme
MDFILSSHIQEVYQSPKGNELMITQILEEANKSFFYLHSMHLDLLKNHAQTISQLAQWLYEEWRPYDTSLTLQKLIDSFGERLNSDQIPITFIVLKKGYPIGCISLKKQSNPELLDYPNNSIWMGSLQVIPEERNQGIGQELLKFSTCVARVLNYKSLYFYTSNFANVEWYIKRGACFIETRPFRDHEITIMQIPL